MEYTLEYLEDKEIVQVKVKGRVNFQIAQQYSKQAIKLAHEYNCKKYLINHSKTSLEANIYKIHTDGDSLENFGFKNTDKIAIVIVSGKDASHFSEDTNSNARWSNFKYFGDVKEAVRWLDTDK
jgi:hypothetical protein